MGLLISSKNNGKDYTAIINFEEKTWRYLISTQSDNKYVTTIYNSNSFKHKP